MSPSSVSPVLSTVLTVHFESTYPETIVSADDLSVVLISKDESSITRQLFVLSVDNSTKSLQIKFPRVDIGFYYLNLVGAKVKRIDPEPLELEVTGYVDSISQLTGPSLGGTLVTIDGSDELPFSKKVVLDKPLSLLVATAKLPQLMVLTIIVVKTTEILLTLMAATANKSRVKNDKRSRKSWPR